MGKIQLTMEDPVPLKITFDIALPKSICKYLEDKIQINSEQENNLQKLIEKQKTNECCMQC